MAPDVFLTSFSATCIRSIKDDGKFCPWISLGSPTCGLYSKKKPGFPDSSPHVDNCWGDTDPFGIFHPPLAIVLTICRSWLHLLFFSRCGPLSPYSAPDTFIKEVTF